LSLTTILPFFNLQTSGTVSLVKNQETKLDSTGITLQLTDSTIPSQSCRDCMTYARLIVKNSDQQKILEYKIGGITGLLQDQADAFNYHFKLLNVLENTVKIEYFKYK